MMQRGVLPKEKIKKGILAKYKIFIPENFNSIGNKNTTTFSLRVNRSHDWKQMYKRDFGPVVDCPESAADQYEAAFLYQEATKALLPDRANFYFQKLFELINEFHSDSSLKDYYLACIFLYHAQYLNIKKGLDLLKKSYKAGNSLAILEIAKIGTNPDLLDYFDKCDSWLKKIENNFTGARMLSNKKINHPVTENIEESFADLYNKLEGLSDSEIKKFRYLGLLYETEANDLRLAGEKFQEGLIQDAAFCCHEIGTLVIHGASAGDVEQFKKLLNRLVAAEKISENMFDYQMLRLSFHLPASADKKISADEYVEKLSQQSHWKNRYAQSEVFSILYLRSKNTKLSVSELKNAIVAAQNLFEVGDERGAEFLFQHLQPDDRLMYFRNQFNCGNQRAAKYVAQHYFLTLHAAQLEPKHILWMQMAAQSGDMAAYDILAARMDDPFALFALSIVEHYGIHIHKATDMCRYPLPDHIKSNYYFQEADKLCRKQSHQADSQSELTAELEISKLYLKVARLEIKDPVFFHEIEAFVQARKNGDKLENNLPIEDDLELVRHRKNSL